MLHENLQNQSSENSFLLGKATLLKLIIFSLQLGPWNSGISFVFGQHDQYEALERRKNNQ